MSFERTVLDLPRLLVAVVGVALGIFALTLIDPPKSECVGQLELFEKSQKGFLFPTKKTNDIVLPARYRSEIETCKFGNGMGGCFGFFQSLRNFIRETTVITPKCKSEFASIKEVKELITESISLMTRLAWGSHPPGSTLLRKGWLQTGDLLLFCDAQRTYYSFYGESGFKSEREKILQNLPGAVEIQRDRLWSLSLFSQPCPSGTFQ